MIPFMSRKRLSYSSPFGFGFELSTGICSPSSVHAAFSSTQSTTIFGYLTESHLKKAGTPIARALVAGSAAARARGRRRRGEVWFGG